MIDGDTFKLQVTQLLKLSLFLQVDLRPNKGIKSTLTTQVTDYDKPGTSSATINALPSVHDNTPLEVFGVCFLISCYTYFLFLSKVINVSKTFLLVLKKTQALRISMYFCRRISGHLIRSFSKYV